ncbi:MAG: nitrilase-related carbon-nitrogen hydrolase, partial [Oscillospiraceae bacterium]
MKISEIQMDMKLGDPDFNFAHAVELVREAAKQSPDVITLPETWNVGFFPKENLAALCDEDGARVKSTFGPLAKEL